MVDENIERQDVNGYVELERIDDGPAEPLTEADIAVEEAMPEDEAIINAEEKPDTGFGQEPGVVIDDTTNRKVRYDDDIDPQYYETNYSD